MFSCWMSTNLPHYLICGVLLIMTPVSALGNIRFEDASQRAGILKRTPTAASAWGDIDNDGWPDLWVSNHNDRPPSLYLNQRDGTFIDIAHKVLSDDAFVDFHGAAWADFDNDGDQDLLVLTGGVAGRGVSPNYFFVNEDGKLINRAKDFGLDLPLGRGRTPLWIDVNRDGKLDVLLMNRRRAEAPSGIYLQNSMGFVEKNQQLHFQHSPQSRTERIIGRIKQLMRLRFPRAPWNITVNEAFAQLAGLTGSSELELVSYMPNTRIFSVGVTRFLDITTDILFPSVSYVQDAAIQDFNGDGHLDWYLARSRPWAFGVHKINKVRVEGRIVSNPKQSSTVLFKTEGEVTFGLYRHWMDPSDPERKVIPRLFIGSKRLELTDPIMTISPNDPTVRQPAPVPTDSHASIFIEFDSSSKVWTLKSSVQVINLVITSTEPIDSLHTQGFNPSNGDLADSLMIRETDQFVSRRSDLMEEATGSVSVVAGDFDNDMDVDLYLVCTGPTENTPNRLYENDGNGNFVNVLKAGGAEGSGKGRGNQVVTADFDRDGFLDLFITNGTGSPPFDEGPHELFRNLGNDNHWLQIDLEGVLSNRDGIGAKVMVETESKVQVREQDGGMHSYSQDHTRIHFGLGPHKKVDRLTIFWPSGAVQHMKDIHTDQILVVRERPGG